LKRLCGYTGYGKIEDVCKGIGVHPDHIRIFKPLKTNWDEMVRIYQEEIAYNGVSVVIPRRECIQTLRKKNKMETPE